MLSTMTFEDILKHLGEFGLYQKRLYTLLCLPSIFIGVETTLHMVFLLAVPKHRCALPGLYNDTYDVQSPAHARMINSSVPLAADGEWESCRLSGHSSGSDYLSNRSVTFASDHDNSTYACDSWVFDDSVFITTVATTLSMVCDRRLLVTHSKSLAMVGQFLGVVISGPLSDTLGRKKTILVSLFIHVALSFCLAWATSFPVFGAIILTLQASGNALYLSAFVFGMEIVGPSKRMWTGVLINLFWSCGVVTCGVVVFLLREWHLRQIILTVPPILFFVYIWLIPESPRWLLMRNRKKEAEAILVKAAHVNNVKLPENLISDYVEEQRVQQKFWYIFTKSRILLFRSFALFVNWFAIGMGFYGLSINITNLSGNIYFHFFIFAIMEAFAYCACLVLIDRLGRKKLHCGTMITSGAACLLTVIPLALSDKVHPMVATVLAAIGNTGVSVAFCAIYIFSAELMPTLSRNSGMAVGSICSRLGAIISPYIADMGLMIPGQFGKLLPLLLFGIIIISAGVASLLLPETINQPLPETIEEAEQIGKVMVSDVRADRKTKEQLPEKEPLNT